MTKEKKQLQLRPRPNRLIVTWDGAASKFGAIHVPDKYKRRPQTGTVVAIGKALLDDPQRDFELGDRILFAQFSGTEAGFASPDNPHETISYLILGIDEVLATLAVGAELVELSASA